MNNEVNKELEVFINTSYIELDKLLKFCGFVSTGGEAKMIISSGDVYVEGEQETRRGRKIYPGYRVKLIDKEVIIRSSFDRMENN